MLKTVSKDIEENLGYLKERLKDCDDIVYRQVTIGQKKRENYYLY